MASTSTSSRQSPRSYECPNLPNEPPAPGEIEGPAQQLHDPAVFEDGGQIFLFYTVCGEQGIAAAEVALPEPRTR
jgi:hypothetical protein